MKEEISNSLKEEIREKIKEYASGRVYFSRSVIDKYRKERGDYSSESAIIVSEMADIANRTY